MFGAVAAGKENGGYENIIEAARKMAHLRKEHFVPDEKNHLLYEKIYAEYERLHDYFGRGENNVMKTLKKIKKSGE